jgi:hypothetical protein
VSIATADELLSEDNLDNTIKAAADLGNKQVVAKNSTCFSVQNAQVCIKNNM